MTTLSYDQVTAALSRAKTLEATFAKRSAQHLARRSRKLARTRIYVAVFGSGGQFDNIPWLAPREMPQDNNMADIYNIVDRNQLTASLSLEALNAIVKRLNTLARHNKYHLRYGLLSNNDHFTIVSHTASRSDAQ